MVTLNWTRSDSDGSIFSKGRYRYYAIIIRSLVEDNESGCGVLLYSSFQEMNQMKPFEIVIRTQRNSVRNMKLERKLKVHVKIDETVEIAKAIAQKLENKVNRQ